MMLKGLRRDARSVSVATASTILAGPNLNRYALLIGCPPPAVGAIVSDGTLTSNADTSSTGVKSTYTVPAGAQAYLTSATANSTAVGGQTSALQLVRGATVIKVTEIFTGGTVALRIPLQAADVVRWNVTGAVALSTSDYLIAIERDIAETRVTLALAGPAVLDAGINLYAGGPPVLLCYDQLGTALHEDVFGIATPAAATIGIVDVFWP